MARRTLRAIYDVLLRRRPMLRAAVCPTLARVFVNRFLKKPLGLRLEGLTVENLEAARLADLFVQALLMFTNAFEVIWAGHFLQRTREDFAQHFPHLNGRVARSLWLRKTT